MGLTLPVVWSDRHRLHDPGGEVWVGVRTPGTEVPARAERIREVLTAAGAPVVEARHHEHGALLHYPALTGYLASAWDDWQAAGLTSDPGQDRVVPYLFPHPGLFGRDHPPRTATAISARAGQFAYDTMTLIGPGTWEAARAAVDVAITAAELVLTGAPVAYACCRRPGHHAARTCFGGSCYLNNAAAAAYRLRITLGGPVAVLDIDAHHGNGTQAMFYADTGVLTGSVHVDPGAGWFPHYLGFADERGSGAAEGANRNLPLPPGAGDEAWLDAVAELADWVSGDARWLGDARCLVVALGVDAAAGDPESPLEVTAEGFRAAGRELGALRLPTVIIQEGGYDLTAIGELVHEVLAGFMEGADG